MSGSDTPDSAWLSWDTGWGCSSRRNPTPSSLPHPFLPSSSVRPSAYHTHTHTLVFFFLFHCAAFERTSASCCFPILPFEGGASDRPRRGHSCGATTSAALRAGPPTSDGSPGRRGTPRTQLREPTDAPMRANLRNSLRRGKDLARASLPEFESGRPIKFQPDPHMRRRRATHSIGLGIDLHRVGLHFVSALTYALCSVEIDRRVGPSDDVLASEEVALASIGGGPGGSVAPGVCVRLARLGVWQQHRSRRARRTSWESAMRLWTAEAKRQSSAAAWAQCTCRP